MCKKSSEKSLKVDNVFDSLMMNREGFDKTATKICEKRGRKPKIFRSFGQMCSETFWRLIRSCDSMVRSRDMGLLKLNGKTKDVICRNDF